MALSQSLNEFRFNMETLDMMNLMGKSQNDIVNMMSSLGFNNTLVNFMLSSRSFLNSVLLRFQLYSEQNLPEARVRTSLTALNNPGVNSLVDYLYCSQSVTQNVTSPVVKQTVVQPVVQQADEPDNNTEEENVLDRFFDECFLETEEPTDSIKISEMFSILTDWQTNNNVEEGTTKDELKEYLSTRLGRQIKSTVTNIRRA